MSADRLVCILTMARSRSSLVAELLHRHGVWTFEDIRQPDQFNQVRYHESQRVKKLINSHRQNIYETLTPTHPWDTWHEQLIGIRASQSYKGGPWMVKVDVFCWPLFKHWDPLFVCVWRNCEGILSSIERTDFMQRQKRSEKEWRKIIWEHQAHLLQVQHNEGGIPIDTGQLVNGYDRHLRFIVETLGLEYKPKIARDVITR